MRTNSKQLFFSLMNTNKLFCTFCTDENVDDTINTINSRYSVLFNKIFILESPQSDELICTYNIDSGNMSYIPMHNTITMHRKKETNTLYTINALNSLIRKLNNGYLDTSYRINWSDYHNTILLTQETSELRQLDTKIHKVIDLNNQ